jgi:RHS repeat-associated protein
MYWLGSSGENLIETDLTGTINEEYIYFNGERIARVDRPSGTVHYYFSNHLGSHTVVTNAVGVCEQDIEYYPYGGVVADYCPTVAQHYKFTGKERDTESGLDMFGARYNASSMGRFMSPDPEQIDGFDHLSDPQSWNGYAYVHNNPLKATDPDGLDCIYIDSDSGKMTGFNRGDCDNSTEEKANSGYYVNGTVDTISENSQGQVTGFSGTGDQPGTFISGSFQPKSIDNTDTHPGLAVLQQPVLGNAAGTVDLLARIEYRTAAFFFPFTGLLIGQVSGIDSGSGVSAAGISRKPGTLGQFKGADALRRENKIARDIMKDLKLGPEAREAVHEALSEGAQIAGRKLTYQEGVTAVKAALGLL